MTDDSGSPLRIFSEMEVRHLFQREVQRCTRYQDFLSIVLIHAVYPGTPLAEMDAAVTHRIADMLRSTDFVGAIGPDIAVLLVHTPEPDAAMIAGRIRDRIQSSTFEVGPLSPHGARVTLSIGVASFPTDGTSDGDLLAHAQAQLQSAQGTPPTRHRS